ncbi:MAG: ABC transporter ATP-binding protein [Anaerolineales bacterium]|nr:ABC transporter ATP-binding protein [Anaerolineales bacterium]
MTPDAAVYCENLSKRYKEVVALDDLTLSVPYGSIFGFLGRNGAGKTTTMRLLAGLALPTTGRAWIAGLETTQTSSGNANFLARTRFGYLPQAPAFYTWMSAREYLDYVAQIQGLTPAERKQQIPELLDLSDLKGASKRRIGGFSGGMLQRLGLAQALIGHPPVLLLDEPTSALDPAGRREVLDMIAQLRGQTTVFLSSHILTDIERVCDTLAVLHNGKLVLVSGRDELLAKYATNAAELVFEPAPDPLAGTLPRLAETLRAQPWVASVTHEDQTLRVLVQDLPRAKQELLPLILAHGLILNRYEWVRPSLEEIFLQLT